MEPFLLAVRSPFAGQPAARYVGGIAVRADEIGIQADHVAVLDVPRARLLVPRIGPLSRSQAEKGLKRFIFTIKNIYLRAMRGK